MFLLLCQKLVGRLQKIFNGIALNLLVKYLNSVEYSNPSTWYICFSLSCVRLFATPWTVAYQAPPSMGFSRQEYWNGLPFPSPGDLPNPGIEPGSPALQADSLPSEPPGKPQDLSFLQRSLIHFIGKKYQKPRSGWWFYLLILGYNCLSSFLADRFGK